MEPQPKLMGLRYVTQYMVTQHGKQIAELALQLTELREVASKNGPSQSRVVGSAERAKTTGLPAIVQKKTKGLARRKKKVPPQKDKVVEVNSQVEEKT